MFGRSPQSLLEMELEESLINNTSKLAYEYNNSVETYINNFCEIITKNTLFVEKNIKSCKKKKQILL